MSGEPTRIFVYDGGDTLLFRVSGRGTMGQSMALRSKVEECLRRGVRRVLVDLRECTYFDSTFLGTLLILKRAATQQGGVEFGLVDPSPECRRLLAQMHMECHFPQLDAVWHPTEGCCELCTDHDSSSFKWNVVCAHQELASLPGPQAESFRPLAERLAAEFTASEPQHASVPSSSEPCSGAQSTCAQPPD